MSRKLILYVDPYKGGHRPDYLSFFQRVCADNEIVLRAYVPEQVWLDSGVKDNPLAEWAQDIDLEHASLFEYLRFIAKLERDSLDRGASLIFFSMIDRFIPPLALRTLLLKPLKVAWSGIYFRDSFNYWREETDSVLKLVKTVGRALTVRIAAEGAKVPLVVFNEHWKLRLPKGVFFIPDAFTELDSLSRSASLQANQWPIPQEPPKTDDRVRFLIFGSLHPRKGVVEFCDGLLLLDDASLKRVSLRVMGLFYGPSEYRDQFLQRFKALGTRGAQVSFNESYVEWKQIDEGLRWCDITVGTYIDHLGQSGILSTGVQYGRPVMTQSSYQLAELAKEYRLGSTVDAKHPVEVAKEIRRALDGRLKVNSGTAAYRERHAPERARQLASAFFAAITSNPVTWTASS